MQAPRYTFPSSHRLGGVRAFRRVFDCGAKASRGPLTVYAVANGLGHPRLGLTVPRRVGNAVRRNGVKRHLREAYRHLRHGLAAADFVVVVRGHRPMAGDAYREIFGKLAEKLTPRLVRCAGMDLLIATRNAGKTREFRGMLAGLFESVEDLTSLDAAGPEPEETGRTFRENAVLKATAYARHYGRLALADDSGLAVDALDGRPGVHSARFAAMNDAGSGDADNNAHLLRLMEDVPDERRGCRFVCVLALAAPDGRVLHTSEGEVAGRLLRGPRGGGGFGYDPLFLHEPTGRTTAEMSPDEKHAVSHRGQALRRMRDLIDRFGVGGDA